MALIQQTVNTDSAESSKPSHVNVSFVSQVGSNDHTSGPTLGNSLVHQFFKPIFDSTHTMFTCTQTSLDPPWIIDSGATDHITSSFAWFQTYSKIKPVHVNLPNGSWVTALYSGIVRFSSTLVIHNVLYVPNFNFNLISISKLISDLHCTLNFSANFCKIQDVTTLKTIGLAKLREGLYHLKISKTEWALSSTYPYAKFLHNHTYYLLQPLAF